MFKKISATIILTVLFFSCDIKRPNIILIIADDMSTLENAHTPRINEIALQGIKFTNAYSQYANCVPSRQSFLTGLSPFRGIRQGRIDEYLKKNNHISMPMFFKVNNYKTISLGKVYHDAKQDKDAWDFLYDISNEENNYYNWESFASKKNKEIKDSDLRPAVENTALPLTNYNDYNIAEKAIEFLSELSSDQFFMTIGFRKPHLPFAAPKKFWEIYDNVEFQKSEFDYATVNGDSVVYMWSELASYKPFSASYKSKNYRDKRILNEQALKLKKGYYSCVSFIDYLIGMITDEIKNLGLDNNTIIVITSDHGFHLGEQQIWGKHTNFKKSTNIPLIIFDPRMNNNKNITEAFVELLDLFPTLVELAGLENKGKMDGKSMVPLIDNNLLEDFSNSFSMYQSFQKDENVKDLKAYALHNKKYTYIEWWDTVSNTIVNQELYDIEYGLETTNIISDPSTQEIVKRLSKKIEIKKQSLK
ncbi:MAG: sulfatase [Flavobacteriaceae bacterium]|nr:sulfatase [Flavobacteriaceae bacterium]MBL6684622.1 sulfatase [Flavobacteriaceae bacterium]